jgi:NH3-dependent NAD+ synthetase
MKNIKNIFERIRSMKERIIPIWDVETANQVFLSECKDIQLIAHHRGFQRINDYWLSQIDKCYEKLRDFKEENVQERIRTQERLKLAEEYVKWLDIRTK